ncbi:MAG: CHAT domain-containing protein [Myxococcales bacterium]|nr:CHAT domain-containing protein [Myxococcales bacterium]
MGRLFFLSLACLIQLLLALGCRKDGPSRLPQSAFKPSPAPEERACRAVLPAGQASAAAVTALDASNRLFAEASELTDSRRYPDADAALHKALQLRISIRGTHDPGLARLLLRLGGNAALQGDAVASMNALICARSLLHNAPQTPTFQSQLADIELFLGELADEQRKPDQAMAHLERAIALLRQLQEPAGWRMAIAEQAYASALAADPARQKEARQYYERALAVFVAGQHTSEVAAAETSLGLLLLDSPNPADHSRAENLLMDSIARLERLQGIQSPSLVAPLSNLILLRLRQGDADRALALAWRVLAISERRLRNEAPALPRDRLLSLLDLLRRDEENLYSVLAERPDLGLAWWQLGLATAFLRQGRALDIQSQQARLEHTAPPAADRQLVQSLREARLHYKDLALAHTYGALPMRDTDLQALSKRIEDLERELAQRDAPLLRLSPLVRAEEVVSKVRTVLPPGSAVITVIEYRRRKLQNPESSQQFPSHYLAGVLTSAGEVLIRDLGPTGPIDQQIQLLRTELADPLSDPKPMAQRVYDAIVRPLWPLLQAHPHWYLALDGWLTLLPFWALHDGQDYLLGRDFQIGYLNSGRDLLRPAGPRNVDAALFANPAYGAGDSGQPDCPQRSRAASLVEDFKSEDPCGAAFTPLPMAEQEAEAVQKLLGCDCLRRGVAATRESLLSVQGPGILLVSTHGFVLRCEQESPASARGDCSRFSYRSRGLTEKATAPSRAMLHSGLALAGANRLKRGQAFDGVVTDLELQAMNLHGTQLAVLSACETGVGSIRMGQGVFGLQRAAMTAGAETVVTSLWSVNDPATRDLMVGFFTELMRGHGRVKALHLAARAVRKTHEHPYYWAPFIAIGNAGPLIGIPKPAGQPATP